MHGLIYNLLTTFSEVDDPVAQMGTTLNGINDNNQLVGFYVNPIGNTIGLLANPTPSTTTVPEPAAAIDHAQSGRADSDLNLIRKRWLG